MMWIMNIMKHGHMKNTLKWLNLWNVEDDEHKENCESDEMMKMLKLMNMNKNDETSEHEKNSDNAQKYINTKNESYEYPNNTKTWN